MIKYFLKKWRAVLNIGRKDNLHYLEKQRIATLNAISLLIIFGSIFITIIYCSLNFDNRFIGLIILPVALSVLFCNYKKKYKIAPNVALVGFIIVITIWAFYTRRTGAQLLYIALASGSVSVSRQRKIAHIIMIACSILFFVYIYYDSVTPFVPNPRINYFIINAILAYTTAGMIFFQAMVNFDISLSISKKMDKNFEKLNTSLKSQKETDEKLKTVNGELSDFNKKLDYLVKKSSEELYSYQMAINDNLSSVITDFTGKILKINDLYLEKTGYTREELVGENIDVLKSDYHDDSFYKQIAITITSGQVWRGESKIKTKDGSDFWISSSILPIKDFEGRITKFLTISANVTDKKIAEEKEKNAIAKLSKSEKRFSLLLENQTDLIVITDKQGNRKYVNKAFCDFFGKDKDYFRGTNYRTLQPDNVDKFYLKVFDSISYENPKITIVLLRENALGQKRWIKWDEIAFFDTNKEVIEILSIGHDITEMKENEFQNANYIAQFEELAFKNSHHFRKPLSNIIGVIDLIDDNTSKDQTNELLSIIKNEINDLDSSSQELSNFINTHSKNSKHQQEIFNLDFIEAKLKHLKWRYRIRHFLDGEGSLTKSQAISHHDCDFGKWYYSKGKEKYGQMESVQKIELQHEKLHHLVRKILELKSEGKTDESEIKYNELVATSDKIIILLDESEQAINNENASTYS
ncbi:MAG: PAS domain S-box protein [Flavobacterium sp.]|uniref:PAS domain S-box protein n=1 Tax=Flavobacterium sp. TaxID=239 RepID=UPI003263D749